MSYLQGECGVPAVMNVQPANAGNYGSGGWGGDWGAWIFAFILMAMCGGWGGFGGFGGFGGGAGGAYPAEAILQRSLDTQTIIGKLDGVTQGLCDGFYAQSAALNGLGMNMMQGFHGVDNAICNLGYQGAQLANGLNQTIVQGQFQNQQCCCETQRMIERGFCDTNYNAATNTTAIIQNAHNDTDRVIAKLDAMEMNRKDERIAEQNAQIQALNLAASMANERAATRAMIDASTAEILRRSGHDCPSAAYIVQPPTPVNFPTNGCGQVNFSGWGNNCGNPCGSCC